jgi:hypothetical protein
MFPSPTVPAGHPFTCVQSANNRSATTNAENPANAWNVNFTNGKVNNNKTNSNHAWCVRGEHSVRLARVFS